eukprot:Pompholyxophrys_sp_v1_NODE_156_length_1477_cov_16.734880.p2 type:complete len:108 gc:universal NODE_156_length_1477_cov_16.734880:913-1236(+)
MIWNKVTQVRCSLNKSLGSGLGAKLSQTEIYFALLASRAIFRLAEDLAVQIQKTTATYWSVKIASVKFLVQLERIQDAGQFLGKRKEQREQLGLKEGGFGRQEAARA